MLKDVSDALGINPSAITAPIGRMEDAGLVRREFSDNDGRAAISMRRRKDWPRPPQPDWCWRSSTRD
jgi:hypothetical protein